MNNSRANTQLRLKRIWIQIIFVPHLACFLKHTANNSTASVKLLSINNNLPLKRNVKGQSYAQSMLSHTKGASEWVGHRQKSQFTKNMKNRTNKVFNSFWSHPILLFNLVLIPPASNAPGWVHRQHDPRKEQKEICSPRANFHP